MKKLGALIICLVSCYILRPNLMSKPRAYGCPASERKFYNEIRSYNAAVVLLYNGSTCLRRERDVAAKELKHTFTRLAKSGFYPRKAVRFVCLNISDPMGRVFALDNNISLENVPAITLFSNGLPVEDQDGVVLLTGNPSRHQLKKFIDAYLTVDIAQHVQEERAFRQYQEIIRDRAHVYYSPYFSRVANPWNDWWGWPYYGQAQGNYGGNMGVNFFASNY